MAQITVTQLKFHLESAIKYLNPFLSFANCHMVNYLTNNFWDTFIPSDIRNEIHDKNDINDAIKLFWNHQDLNTTLKSNKFQSLQKFLDNYQQYTLDSLNCIWLTIDEINLKLADVGCNLRENTNLQIKEFMSAKKCSEVEATSELVANLCTYNSNPNQPLFIVDAGDGKGYLSSRLALEYNLKVLGIDASATNTVSAQKRINKLEKAWSSLTKRAEDIKNGQIPPRKGKRSKDQVAIDSQNKKSINYQTTTHFITTETDFLQLIERHFPNANCSGICLSGLHTCGNLASSSLQIFNKNSQIHTLCNIGCCYHLLSEEFHQNEFFANRNLFDSTEDNGCVAGFPMSEYLKNQKYKLGRNARMLASQSIYRTINAKELPNVCLFYRAIFEVLISDQLKDQKYVQVGKIKKFDNFPDYIQKCIKRIGNNLNINDIELNLLLEKYDYDRQLLNLFYLIRMTLAPIIETIILLDRLLYLKENFIDQSYLTKLFDSVVSPRCYAIVAMK